MVRGPKEAVETPWPFLAFPREHIIFALSPNPISVCRTIYYTIAAKRDVPQLSFFGIAFLALLFLPV